MSSNEHFQYQPGLRLSEEETEFLMGVLLGVAEGAKKEDKSSLFNTAMSLRQRVQQAEIAGQGVPPELHDRLQRGLTKAMSSKKPEIARRAMENFLATMVRLHPDPARALSAYIVNLYHESLRAALEPSQMEAAREGAIQIIERFGVKLEALIRTYEDDGEYPEAGDLLDYLRQWNDVGRQAIQNGDEPWASDEHVAAALAESMEDAEADADE